MRKVVKRTKAVFIASVFAIVVAVIGAGAIHFYRAYHSARAFISGLLPTMEEMEERIFELTTQVRVRDADLALIEMRSFVREAIFNTTMSEFSTVGRLVTFEAPLTTTYTLDTSMGTWGLFHQSVEVTQQGTGTFSTDLSAIHPDNIIWDDYISTLTILVP